MGYKRGDVIMENKPWAYIVNDDYRDKCCHYCFTSEIADDPLFPSKTNKLQRCSGCRFAYFCNASCLKFAWKDHKFECQRIKKLQETNTPLPTAQVRLAARVFNKYFRGDIMDPACRPTSNRTFLTLWHHADKVRESVGQLAAYKKVMGEVRQFIGNENVPVSDDDELLPIYNRITVNSINMDDGEVQKGIGVFLGASMFDHSCRPNADFFIRDHGATIYIVALDDVPDISSVRLRYGDVFEPTWKRREYLEKTYFFTCDCELCQDTKRDNLYRAVCCSNCRGPVPLSVTFKSTGPCSRCKTILTADILKQAKQLSSEIPQMLTQSERLLSNQSRLDGEVKRVNFVALRNVYNKSIKNVLHPWNWVYVKFVQHIMDYYILLEGEEDVELRAQWFMECVEAYRRFDVMSPTLGVRLVVVAEFLALHERSDEAKRYFDEAESIVLMFFGKEHSLYQRMSMSRSVMEQFEVVKALRL
ncbi:histone-lysine N-methyltransferase set-18-like [Paramacrobiotus metropolitanus]|uniref:histone-lysine N-methyltransferase set-18-like n=1 Tax=Paramacrobiotus metropolitanus TaxID=2943436 RepID=UPI0024462C7F|nr:histone-lysine N-methyltransferase set-18-like [Paramacrobiotus metropolitanus]